MSKEKLLDMAKRLEAGYFIPISGITDIAEAVALLLRLEAVNG